MYPLKQSTSITVPFFAHDENGDAVLLLSGFTARYSKDGGAFGDMTVTINEMEGGWYSLLLTAAHTDTLGVLTIFLTHASCKQVNIQFRIEEKLVAEIPSAADIMTALKLEDSWLTGSGTGTMTFKQIMAVLAAWSLGLCIDKPGGPTGTFQVLDPEDGTTVIFELTLKETTPFKSGTIA